MRRFVTVLVLLVRRRRPRRRPVIDLRCARARHSPAAPLGARGRHGRQREPARRHVRHEPGGHHLHHRADVGFNVFQNWRNSTSPGGTGTGSDAGMPNIVIVNRIKETPYYVSGSFGSYRTATSASSRPTRRPSTGSRSAIGTPLESRGGTSDFRLAVGYRNGNKLALGVGFHFLTGSNRFFLSRIFYRLALRAGAPAFRAGVQRDRREPRRGLPPGRAAPAHGRWCGTTAP